MGWKYDTREGTLCGYINMTYEQKNDFLVLEYKYECKNIILYGWLESVSVRVY
jgi:hypothetical protein